MGFSIKFDTGKSGWSIVRVVACLRINVHNCGDWVKAAMQKNHKIGALILQIA